ncbi:MAG: MFS transporter [Commensalibacter sp.]|nr:MFS transporter [Commensalibacter sp.]
MQAFTRTERNVVFACVSSWMLDAFDFFILVFVLTQISKTFSTALSSVSVALTLTLAARPIGAFIFGRAAEKYGRKPVLMANILSFTSMGLLAAFSPNLIIFLILRFIYGIPMGGIWGVASSLAMETISQEKRGFVSGMFQAGYPAGYLLAAIVNYLFLDALGWRGLFILGALPALLVIFIYYKVPESPSWQAVKTHTASISLWKTIQNHFVVCLFAVLLMTCFNFFSHGTQDLYPTFLEVNHHLDHKQFSVIAIFYNIAGILGGLFFGSISQYLGRRQAIMLAAVLAIPVIPLWAFSSSIWGLGIGAFIIQFMVQGAWGVVPAYLNELMPEGTKATLSGLVYQTGNLFASVNAILQPAIASQFDNNYGIAMAMVTGTIAICLIILMFVGKTFPKTHPDFV